MRADERSSPAALLSQELQGGVVVSAASTLETLTKALAGRVVEMDGACSSACECSSWCLLGRCVVGAAAGGGEECVGGEPGPVRSRQGLEVPSAQGDPSCTALFRSHFGARGIAAGDASALQVRDLGRSCCGGEG